MHHISEAEALDDMSDGGAEDDLRELEEESLELKRSSMENRYHRAKKADVGATISCPTCGKLIVKTTYNKIFCSNGRTHKGRNCKDSYWNFVDESRCMRASRFK